MKHDASESGAGHEGAAAIAVRHVVGGYREHAPPSDLEALVSALWSHRPDPAGRSHHRVLPEPDVSVCYVNRRAADGRVEPVGLFFIGAIDRPRVYDPAPGVTQHAVQLKPEWCRALLGIDPSEHRDAVEDLVALRPRTAAPLLDDVSRLSSRGAVLARLADAVRAWAAEAGAEPSSSVAHRGLERLRRAPAGARIQEAFQEWAVSSRHLRRAVRSATGASPKRMLRAKRLTAALFRADGREDPAWSRIALASGYCDQSHLIRECNALAGAAPGAIHAERRAESGGHGAL